MSKNKLLVSELRKLAQKVYDEGFVGKSGICFEFNSVNKTRTCDSKLFSTLVDAISGHALGLYLCPKGKKWKQRAMFCLLLAESIEQEE